MQISLLAPSASPELLSMLVQHCKSLYIIDAQHHLSLLPTQHEKMRM